MKDFEQINFFYNFKKEEYRL